MSGVTLSLVIEGAVCLLLGMTIFYCIRLNRHIVRLHADREDLRQIVANLLQATVAAKASIRELQQVTEKGQELLGEQLNEAERFSYELNGQIQSGRKVLEDIGRIVSASKPTIRSSIDAVSGSAFHKAFAKASGSDLGDVKGRAQ